MKKSRWYLLRVYEQMRMQCNRLQMCTDFSVHAYHRLNNPSALISSCVGFLYAPDFSFLQRQLHVNYAASLHLSALINPTSSDSLWTYRLIALTIFIMSLLPCTCLKFCKGFLLKRTYIVVCVYEHCYCNCFYFVFVYFNKALYTHHILWIDNKNI